MKENVRLDKTTRLLQVTILPYILQKNGGNFFFLYKPHN